MALPTNSGGEQYIVSADSNISKLAEMVTSNGAIRLTDVTLASAAVSYGDLYIESGQLKIDYTGPSITGGTAAQTVLVVPALNIVGTGSANSTAVTVASAAI